MSKVPTPSREDIIALREQGQMNRQQIADYYGVKLSRVKRWIKELAIPEPPTKQKKKIKAAPARVENGLTLVEQARAILGKRMGEDYRGFLLDGRPVRVDVLIRAAKLTIPDVP